VASNVDGVLLGTALPFSWDEGRRREIHSLNCFGSFDGSIPTLGVPSTARKSWVGGVAASCGTTATTTNSTYTGCASETPAGTTSGGEGTMEQRLARDQFSTREQVAMYHWIMLSEQFSVG
jgi:hypothetical protein